MGESPLKLDFPMLFSLASAKDATIADLWEKGGNGYHCSLEGTFKFGKWK